MLAAALLAVAAPRGVASPFSLDYGGRLTAADGSPVSGTVELQIGFFAAATGGSPLLGGPLTFKGQTLTNGVFQVHLGLTQAQLAQLFDDGAGDVFVEVTDVTHAKTYPRQRFGAVPYALRVPVDGTSVVYDGNGKLSVGAVDAAKVTGLSAMLAGMGDAAKLQGVPLGTGTPAAGAVLKYVGGQWQAAAGDSVSGNFGIGTTSAQTALDVAGVLTQRGAGVPALAPAGEGRIYFDATSNQFMVSQNGGAYAPLGTVTGGVITQVSAGTGLTGGGTTGNVTVGLAAVGTAGTYTKVWTDANGRVTAGGTLTAADLPSVPVGMISGTLAAAQVAAIPVAQLAGTLATTQLPSVPVTQLSGTLTAAQLPSLSEAQITSGTLSVALGGTGATSFPSGGVVVGAGSLPLSTVSAGGQYQVLQEGASGPVFGAVELGQSAAVSGTLAVAHLPQIPASLVTGSLAAGQISGTLAAAQVGPMPASQITGTLAAAQVGPIPVTQVSGTLAAAQVGTIPATQISGTLASAQVGTIPVTQLSGTLAATQVGTIPVTQLSGTFTAAQLPSIPATSITGSLGAAQISGTLAATQIAAIPTSQITGTLAANQVASLPVTQLTGTLAAAQVAPIPASQITGSLATTQLSGTLAASQVGAIPTSQITGTLAGSQLGAHSAALITSGTLAVAQGGTGSGTALSGNRVMISSGGAIVEAPALANGQLLIGSSGASPVAATLSQGTTQGVTIGTGAGSLTLDTAQDIRTSAVPQFAGLKLSSPATGSLVKVATGGSLAAATAADVTGLIGGGTFVNKAGDTMSGQLTVNAEAKLGTINQGTTTTERFYPNVISQAIPATVNGAWIIHTPLVRNSGTMFTVHVRGYAYAAANLIDFTVTGYAYGGSTGNVDGQPGAIYNATFQDLGSDGWNKYVGVDASGNVAVAFGDTTSSGYFYRMMVDAWVTGSTSDYASGWSIDQTTTAGFGWLDKRGPLISRAGGLSSLASGSVGIGTTSPSLDLHVASSKTSATGILLQNTDTGGHGYQLLASGSGASYGAGAFGIYDQTQSAYRMIISPSGDVGIGTTSPRAKLDISGNIVSTSYNDVLAGNAANMGGWKYLGAGPAWLLGGWSGDNTAFRILTAPTGSANGSVPWRTSLAVHDATGNVGIGTTSASATLQVIGTMKVFDTRTVLVSGALYGTTAVYGPAPSDAILTVYGTEDGTVGYGRLQVATDPSPTPSTVVAWGYTYNDGTSYKGSISLTVPIRKGEYYQIQCTTGCSGTNGVAPWISTTAILTPLGDVHN